MIFNDKLFDALGAWQKGWRGDRVLRSTLAANLQSCAAQLPVVFRSVAEVCYRKRFLHQGELAEIILADSKDEGLVSWTTKREFAERFNGKFLPGAVSGAIFRHRPEPSEVVLNVSALWKCDDFRIAAESYRDRSGEHAYALFNFTDGQGEVMLEAPLRGSEIVALTGASSPFDELCEQTGIPESQRDELFKKMVKQGTYFEEARYIDEDGAQRAIYNTLVSLHKRIMEEKAKRPSEMAI